MNIDTTLGGYLIDVDGARHQLPVVLNPNNSTIENVIKKVSSADKGVVVLKCEPTPEIGPEKLTMHADTGNFLLMLGVNDVNGNHNVRTLTNESTSNDLMIVMPEKYPAQIVIRDVSLVCTIFNEFARFRDVSLT